MGYRIVVVGATGNVGREMLNILDERQFPVDAIEVLASRRSLGTECMLGDKTMKTKDLPLNLRQNGSACFGCMLVPETSCENFNKISVLHNLCF